MSNLTDTLKDPAKRCSFIFGQPMQPCPKCGGYNLKQQTPIKMDILPTDSARQVLGKWARATRDGAMMEGPVFIMCFDCAHKGPAVDCSGRTREDVGEDASVSAQMKTLWNEQKALP